MIASHRDREITFYEELGVTPAASSEEIRDSFRLFVRLLHPDQQTDPLLKEIAEKQMRKLNRIYAVLSDPESRRRYDEALDGDYSPAIILNTPSPDLRRLTARLTWAAAIVASAILLIWLASDNTPAVQNRTPDPSAGVASAAVPASPVQSSSEVSRLRSDLSAVIVERDAAIGELNRLRGTSPIQTSKTQTSQTQTQQIPRSGSSAPPEEPGPRPAPAIAEPPSVPRLRVLAAPALPRIERPASWQLTGFWFYAKPPQGQTNKNSALYPPEFIEAIIAEEGGVIHGSFRSRFQIVDRAISPDVIFIFNGIPNGPQITCPWMGAGGARGELTLKLTSENSMRIDWTASELGSRQGLSSGTAVLTRRIE
jgi:hypothetical protein